MLAPTFAVKPIERSRAPTVRLAFVIALFALVAFGTVRTLAVGIWKLDDHAFEPMVLLLAIGMAIVIRGRPTSTDHPVAWGMAVLLLGALVLVIGIVLGNLFGRALGLWLMALGLTMFLGGAAVARRNLYPFVAALFALPLPGALLTAMTFPMKMRISALATTILSAAGLPIANEGVLIDIGNYRLLVADACSGLQSMYSLLSVAVVYLFLLRVNRVPRVVILLVAALPIVFFLNVLRVMALALITYTMGNAAGEGFLHGIAGFAMFILALLLLMAVDKPLERQWPRLPR